MKRQSAFHRFISNFSGEFTVGAVKRPIDDVGQMLSQDNQPMDVTDPVADEGGSYEVCPCIVLTQAKDSEWTLILYCVGDYLVRAPDHLRGLSKDLSADAILHAHEDTSGVEEIALYRAGQLVSTFRDSGTQELVVDYMNAIEDNTAPEDKGAAPSADGSALQIVDDYDSVYDALLICPIAATVDVSRTLRIEATALDRLKSAIAYELSSFRWRGLVDVEGNWAERIDLDSFLLSTIGFGFAPVDSLVLIKSKETIEDREVIQTTYHFAAEDGLKPLDKRAASELLTERAVAQMKHTKSMPIKTEVKKSHKNGNIDLLYKPTRHDQFILKLNKSNVGQDVQAFVSSLSPARHAISFGSVEPAKSGRSTCRTCNQKIEKGELRIGEYFENSYEYPPSRWHHARCIRFSDMERLHNFEQLSAADQAKLAELLDDRETGTRLSWIRCSNPMNRHTDRPSPLVPADGIPPPMHDLEFFLQCRCLVKLERVVFRLPGSLALAKSLEIACLAPIPRANVI